MNSNQPKPAPTAEEQLPPYDERYVELTEDLGSEELDADVKIRLAHDCRERQLLAALRSNREKDAKIAELTSERDHTWTQRNADLFAERNAAEASLRAVSDALDEKLERVDPGRYGKYRYVREKDFDAFNARIRAIVEGK